MGGYPTDNRTERRASGRVRCAAGPDWTLGKASVSSQAAKVEPVPAMPTWRQVWHVPVLAAAGVVGFLLVR